MTSLMKGKEECYSACAVPISNDAGKCRQDDAVRLRRKSKSRDALETSLPKTKSLSSVRRDGQCASMPSVASSSSVISPPPPPTINVPRSGRVSRAHTRRFHRRFPAVRPDEKLFNYYSCALLADILLQGILYISENYFAFYSNIFGYKTKILIPVVDVVKVSKERTAKIIPNAVGILTEDAKYVFGSLLSRDATFRLMQQVWMKSTEPDLSLHEDSESDNTSPLLPIHMFRPQNGTEDEDDSISGASDPVTSDDLSALPTPSLGTDDLSTPTGSLHGPGLPRCHLASDPTVPIISFCSAPEEKRPSGAKNMEQKISARQRSSISKSYLTRLEETFKGLCSLPRPSKLLILTTVLLALLFVSGSVLLYRVSAVHHRMVTAESLLVPDSHLRLWDYQKQRQKQHEMLSEEVVLLTQRLKERIEQLVQVRTSLEDLLAVASKFPNLCPTSSSQEAANMPLRMEPP